MESSEYTFILKPSSLGGIGVFAAQDIPAGTVINPEFNLRRLKIKDIPPPFLQYCIYINDEECYGPERFDRMEIGWYLNHSATPNIARKESFSFTDAVNNREARPSYAIKNIKAGEEIFMDYNALDEPEEKKEDYYKPK